ncbi:hypothetical protein WICPIJ_001169 [Wickerhamomyces pijperi]|uniref:Uncharacterized protein n=1 Tax=Wickerhamomyces pijperi TaxID=599730 RepID=A0A9P8TRK3_WICPI|nr:hypothetical protein WICPIJ_001169 [Wickerhamomyces pijperi]
MRAIVFELERYPLAINSSYFSNKSGKTNFFLANSSLTFFFSVLVYCLVKRALVKGKIWSLLPGDLIKMHSLNCSLKNCNSGTALTSLMHLIVACLAEVALAFEGGLSSSTTMASSFST